MLNRFDSIYLSPHLDDAALSCGGQIFAQTSLGKRVLIVTVMAGDPIGEHSSDFVSALHDRWALASDAVARRREEDIAACQLLGADFLHWDLPDCIYRLHPATGLHLYTAREDIFGEIHPVEANLESDLAQRINTLPGCDRLYIPLTVGHHVDHQLVRNAARSAIDRNRVYYEDYPYVQSAGALNAVIPADRRGWQSELISLDHGQMQAKAEAVSAFASQLSTFFVDRADLERQIQEYADSVGGERVWRSDSS